MDTTEQDFSDSPVIVEVKKNMTEIELRQFKRIEQMTTRLWRIYWVRILHDRGHSNVAIAKQLAISESTVRNLLKYRVV